MWGVMMILKCLGTVVMLNEPEKWAVQQWTVPAHILILRRDGIAWHFLCEGVEVAEVPAQTGETMAACFSAIHQEEDWIDRHSLQFRWLRFWYRRKKRREARRAEKSP
jgi:hypothetical protein